MNKSAGVLVIEVIVLVCGGYYLYQRNPTGFMKVVDDAKALVLNVPVPEVSHPAPANTPVQPTPAPVTTTIQPPTSAAPSAANAPAPATPSAPEVVNTTTPAAPTWSPPAVLPQQPNWSWTTISGQTYNNVRVISVDRDSVMITHSTGGERVPLAYLPSYLQKLFNYTPPGAAPATTASMTPASPATSSTAPAAVPAPAPAPVETSGPPPITPSSTLGAMLAGNLVAYKGGNLQSVPDSAMQPVRYLALYYSAQWCPPCHAFTPKLVEFYNGFKPKHPDFDLVFVSEDTNEDQMKEYMQLMAMPWPAITYGQLSHQPGSFKGPGIESFANTGIPDLVLVDSTGKVLSDSFHGSEYVGPETVIADIQTMVK